MTAAGVWVSRGYLGDPIGLGSRSGLQRVAIAQRSSHAVLCEDGLVALECLNILFGRVVESGGSEGV